MTAYISPGKRHHVELSHVQGEPVVLRAHQIKLAIVMGWGWDVPGRGGFPPGLPHRSPDPQVSAQPCPIMGGECCQYPH
eukprot:351172-Rhodomonas_salina.1